MDSTKSSVDSTKSTGIEDPAFLDAASSDPDAAKVATRRPRRLVLITVDSLRADHVGALSGHVETPALDRLVREGTAVLEATTPTPSTGPAHASLWTGLHPWRHGMQRDAVPVSSDVASVVERVAESGIATAAFVSTALLHEQLGFARGFDTFHFAPTESLIWGGKRREKFWSRGAATASVAADWISEHQTDSFLVWVHLFDVHAPYLPPDDLLEPADVDIDLAGKLVPRPLRGPDDLALAIRRYRGEVRYADQQVARVLDRLDELGLADSTHVVLTADHGEGLGDHGWLEHDDNLFDELIRVPLIVRGPEVPAGRRVTGPAQLEDVAPTMLAALSVPPLEDIDGLNLLPWIQGKRGASPRAESLGQRRPDNHSSPLFYVRDGATKWIGDPAAEGKAFDLALDSREFSGTRDADTPVSLTRLLAQIPVIAAAVPAAAAPTAATVKADTAQIKRKPIPEPAAKPAASAKKAVVKAQPTQKIEAVVKAPVVVAEPELERAASAAPAKAVPVVSDSIPKATPVIADTVDPAPASSQLESGLVEPAPRRAVVGTPDPPAAASPIEGVVEAAASDPSPGESSSDEVSGAASPESTPVAPSGSR